MVPWMVDHAEPRSERPLPAGSTATGAADKSSVAGVTEFRRVALAVGFGVLVLALLVFLVVIYSPVTTPVLWAAVLATLFFPLHRRVLGWVGGRERLAATCSTVLTILIFAVPVALLATNLLAEAQNLWPSVRDYLGSDVFERLARSLDNSPLRPILLRFLPESAQSGAAGIEEALRGMVSGFGDRVVARAMTITRDAPGVAISMGITVLVYFFFLRNGPGWLKLLENAIPLAPGQASNLLQIAGRTINAVFRGVVVTAAVQGVLAGVGFAVAGAPAPVILGVVTMVAALIPFVGPVFVWLPVSAALFATGRVAGGVGLFLWGALVVSLVDNVLRPVLIGRQTKLPLLWLFLSIIGGLRVFGFLGVLIGPAVLSLFLACYNIYMEAGPRRRF